MSRENNVIYLIGESSEISGDDFPSNKEVLKLFFHKRESLNNTIRKSAAATVKKVEKIWQKAQIPVRSTKHSIRKLEKLHKSWQKLQKNQLRKSSKSQKIKERAFQSTLNNLFDIAHHNALRMTRTEERRDYLKNQRKKRRRESESSGIKNNERDNTDSSQQLSGTTTGTDISEVSNFEDEIEASPLPKKIRIMTASLAAALDRTKTSSRSATYIVAAVAASLGHDVDRIILSRSGIHRQRADLRRTIATTLKQSVQIASFVVVHWDGKLLPEITGKGTVERLPIIVSGSGSEQLLGVPKLTSATGANQAAVIVKTLSDWNITDRVRAMCSDTTSSNTGRLNGASTLIEKTLGRQLIYLPCRHHIFELILRSVFEIYWSTTSGPNTPIFKRFQQAWADIDTSQYETSLNDDITSEILNENKEEILAFIYEQLENSQPRDDYREFLELSCIFLNGMPPRKIHFKVPGAMHHARWLSKAIYSLKIFIFKSQFHLTAMETNGLRQICIFIIMFYVRAWFRAPFAVAAPFTDLQLLQNLIQYGDINPKVSKIALKKLTSHLWYLSEDLVALGFFDDSVPLQTKSKMAQAIQSRESVTQFTKRAIVDDKNLRSCLKKDLDDFVTKKSLSLFESFDLPYDFLGKNPQEWSADPTFQKCLQFFRDMKVVNDIAERGVALIESYNDCLTRDEEQKQFLLQVVQDHRKKFPNCNKSNLTSL